MTRRGRNLTLCCLGLIGSLWVGVKALADYDPRWLTQAPVVTVNGAQGAVTVPTVQRQVSSPLDATPGTVTWSFPGAFAHMPTCWPSLTSPNTSYSFDYPTTSAISLTSVTVQVVAHLNTVTIGVAGAVLPVNLPLAVSPPAGTTITLSCVGALP